MVMDEILILREGIILKEASKTKAEDAYKELNVTFLLVEEESKKLKMKNDVLEKINSRLLDLMHQHRTHNIDLEADQDLEFINNVEFQFIERREIDSAMVLEAEVAKRAITL